MHDSSSESKDPFTPETITDGMQASSGDAFIIVVCAPNPLLGAMRAVVGFHRCKMDQVSHMENGRLYYRLRIGFFSTLMQAEAALAIVRKHHQASFIEQLSISEPTNPTRERPATPSALSDPLRRQLRTLNPPANADKPVALAGATQTLRALTAQERDDPHAQKWFVVELVRSQHPINLDTMPRLDVFIAYRLYVVMSGAGTQHVLRLGFFEDAALANNICEYLASFFAAPTIVRVSSAERERFGDREVTKPQPTRLNVAVAKVLPLSPTRAANPLPAVSAQGRKASTNEQGDSANDRSDELALSSSSNPPATDTKSRARRPPPRPLSRTKAKSLNEELLEEARKLQQDQVERKRTSYRNGSWLSRFVRRR